MKLHRSVIRLILLTSLAGALSAAEIDGVLMDKMCSMKAAKEGQTAATMHTRQCAMMPDCEKSGYGVFTADNKYLVFDPAGNEQASCGVEGLKEERQSEGQSQRRDRRRHNQGCQFETTVIHTSWVAQWYI